MSVPLKVGICLPEVSGAVCGLALPGQAVFGAVLALLLQLWKAARSLISEPAPSPVSHCSEGFGVPF